MLEKNVKGLEEHLSTSLLKKMNNPWAETTLRRKRRKWVAQNEDLVEGLQMGDCNIQKKKLRQESYSKNVRLCPRRKTPDLQMRKRFIPQNSKGDALSSSRTPIIPQRETYVTKGEPCESMANQVVHHFLDPGHSQYRSQLLP